MSSTPPTNILFTGEEDWDCPLCMEEMDLSDKNFRPCPCGYQVCRFCWHKIREDGNERCPACRKTYSEEEAEFTPVPQEEINRMRLKKKAIKEKREAAAEAELDLSPAGVALTNEIVNSRRHLCEFRVVQRNLVYVIGVSAKIAHEHILKENEFFGQFGKIIKIVVNKKNFLASTSGVTNPPSASAYITFVRKDDAARAIEYVDGSVYDDRVIRATYGTTKYCSYFLRGLTCQNPGCMYLHEPGEEVQSFTKEQLSSGNHNLHSFIVDKSESVNLRQFGTILYNGPSSKPTPPTSSSTPVPLLSQAPINSSLPQQSTTPAPSRSQNDSPKSFTSVPSAPPGLKAPVGFSAIAPVEQIPQPIQVIPERVPLINEISTNSFFDRISKMVTASELEEFASMAPRGLSFFAPKSPPPPPPALSSFFNFSPLDTNNLATVRSQTSSPAPIESNDPISNNSSVSSCPSRQSFSFSNLPIRSPKLSMSPISTSNTFALQNIIANDSPIPVQTINEASKINPVESLFPSDYRPAGLTNSSADYSNSESGKRFYSGSGSKQSVHTSSSNGFGYKPTPINYPVSNYSNHSSNSTSNFYQSSSQAALKITIAGKPIETSSSTSGTNSNTTSNNNSGVASVKKPISSSDHTNSIAFTNRNLFDLLQGAENVEIVESGTTGNVINTKGTIGSIKTISISSHSMQQPQTLVELERMAREKKLDNHITGLEETMFRTRLEAESLENKLKMLFEASAQSKQRPGNISVNQHNQQQQFKK